MKQRKTIAVLILIGLTLIGAATMARGHEDWFITKTAFGKALSDVGELGARLGIPYSFTRSGKVIYSDGFEVSLAPWNIITGAGYGTIVRDNVVSFRGSYSAKFTPSATSPYFSEMTKGLPFTLSGKIGIEVVVGGEVGADNVYIQIGIRKDGWYYDFRYKFTLSTTTLYYLNPGNAWTEIDAIGGDLAAGGGVAQLLKLVVDTDSLTYQYVRFNNKVYDLSGIDTLNFDSPLSDAIIIGLRAGGISAAQGVIRFDDLTVTIDEP